MTIAMHPFATARFTPPNTGGRVADGIVDAIAGAIAQVPGLVMTHIAWHDSEDLRLDLELDCWGPTLEPLTGVHVTPGLLDEALKARLMQAGLDEFTAQALSRNKSVDSLGEPELARVTALDDADLGRLAVTALAPFLAAQASLSAHAAAHGLASPMDHDAVPDGGVPLAFGAILVDRALMSIQLELHGHEEALHALTERMRVLSEGVADQGFDPETDAAVHEMDPMVDEGSISIEVTTGRPVLHWTEVIASREEPDGDEDNPGTFRVATAHYDGHALNVEGTLPETALAAAAGRLVGDLVATGFAALDALAIRAARVERDGAGAPLTVIEVEPELVAIRHVHASADAAAAVPILVGGEVRHHPITRGRP